MRANITRPTSSFDRLGRLLLVLGLGAPATALAQPANDNPATAYTIAPTPGGSCTATCGSAGYYGSECANITAPNTTAQNVNFTVAAATGFGIAAPPCGNYQGADAWYKFTVGATAGQQSFRLTLSSGTVGTPMTDGAMAAYIYDGTTPLTSPSAFSFVGCSENGNGNMPVLALSCLTAGRTYYVRVWAEGNLPGNGQTFKLCFQRSNNNAPSNDDPCGAVNLPVNASCVNATLPAAAAPWLAGPRNQYACATGPGVMADPSCRVPTVGGINIYRGGDVWFKVTVPANGAFTVTSSTSVNTPSLTTMCMAAYTAGNGGADCSVYTSFNELVCNNGTNGTVMPSITLKCLTPGNVIYFRCYSINNSAIGYFNICATSTADPVPQSNDNPCTAITVPINTCLNSATEVNTTACLTIGVPDPSCATVGTNFGPTTRDVWYKFQAPASGGAIVDVNGGTSFKPGLAVYQTPNLCSDPMAQVGCNLGFASGNFNASVPLSGLTAGAFYYIRVWGTATAGGGSNTTANPFTICVNSVAAPSAGNCNYMLHMVDTGTGANLGWGPGASACTGGCGSAPASGTSYLRVTINGVSTYYSNPDESTYSIFQVPTAGSTPHMTVTYFANSNASTGQAFRLFLFGVPAQIHPSGTGTTTTTFTASNYCTTPPRPPQDCIGAYTICTSQPLTTTFPPGTGDVNDLNGVNRGCLSGEFGSGLWYFFRPRRQPFPGADVSGLLEMTIPSPDGGDYDWAIWRITPGTHGNAATICPPATAPFRCTWAATAGDPTGMGNGATDVTEGAGGDGFVQGIQHTAGVDEMFIMYVNRFATSTLMTVTLTWSDPAGLLDCSQVLPVSFVDLSANTVGQEVDVKWTTASEENSAMFIVERSADNEHFVPIGEVPAMGYSQEMVDYVFRDKTPMNGANYYRLQQVDMDGMTTPTTSVVALVGHDTSAPVIFPNPVKHHLYAAVNVPIDGKVTMRVLDALGRVVSSRTEVAQRGVRTLEYTTSGMAPGSYTLMINTEDGTPIGMARFMQE